MCLHVREVMAWRSGEVGTLLISATPALLGAVTCHVEAPVKMHDAVWRSAGTHAGVTETLRCVFDDMNFAFCLFLHLHSCTDCCMVSAGTVFTGFRKENLGD